MKKYIAIVLASALAISLGAFLTVSWLDDSNDPTEVATQQALATAAMQHMPKDAKLVRVQGRNNHLSEDMSVGLDYELGDRTVRIYVEASTHGTWAGSYGCSGLDPTADVSCEVRKADDDIKVAVAYAKTVDNSTAERDLLGVSVQRPGQVVNASVSTSSPTNPPIRIDILTAIATDPLVGLKTSRRMLDDSKDTQIQPAR